METPIVELLQTSLRHSSDLPGFYAAIRQWFTDNVDSESLIFYQPSPLENLPFDENHKAEPYVLRGDAHPPGDMEVSALQFRDQGICSDDSFLIHFQTRGTWFGALEGSGDVPDLLSEGRSILGELFQISSNLSNYELSDRINNYLLEVFAILNEESDINDATRGLLEIVADALDCEELGFYQQRENHYELTTSMGFDPEQLANRQFYPREQLRKLGMDQKFHALEPSEETDETHLFLPLTFSKNRQGLIVAYETPYRHDTLTEADRLTFKMINILATLASSVIESNFSQDYEEIWDRVTNLRTESFFLARLEQEVERGDRYGYSFSLLIFEIENLEDIEENFGDSTMNEIIRKLSHLVKTTFRIIDTACRFNNNQFGVLFPNTEREGAIKAGNRLIELIDDPFFTIGDREVSIRLDGGVAKYPEDGGSPEDLLKQARLALYEAKQNATAKLESSQDLPED